MIAPPQTARCKGALKQGFHAPFFRPISAQRIFFKSIDRIGENVLK